MKKILIPILALMLSCSNKDNETYYEFTTTKTVKIDTVLGSYPKVTVSKKIINSISEQEAKVYANRNTFTSNKQTVPWLDLMNYKAGTQVFYNNNYYIALNDNFNVNPIPDTLNKYWYKSIEKTIQITTYEKKK